MRTHKLFSVSGKITQKGSSEAVPFVKVTLLETNYAALSDVDGNYKIENIKPGTYTLEAFLTGYKVNTKTITISSKKISLDLQLSPQAVEMGEVVIQAEKDKTFGIARLKDVEGTAIYAGKKK